MELQWIKWVQSFNTPFLDLFFEGVTMLGEEMFYIVVLGFFYWCINKADVKYLVMALTLTSVVNSAFKELVNSPRPFLLHDVRALRTETAHGSSFPSGHTQIVATFYSMIAYKYKKIWLWILAIILTALVGLSRIYLGVHWPKDILGAIVITILLVYVLTRLSRFEERSGLSWPYYIVTVLVLVMLIFLRSENYVKASAAYLGFVIGGLFESHYINFDVRAPFGKQILKFLIGLVLALIVFEGSKLLLPDALIFTWLRYFGTLFTVMAIAPWIYVKLRLTENRIF